MRRERLAARGIFRACESGFGMQAPYVTRLIRNTGENFLNLSGSFLDVCGAGRSWRVLHNAPPPGSPAQRSAARADGAAGARGRREAAGSRPRRLWGGGQLWDPINYVTLGCRFSTDAKRSGGGRCWEAREAPAVRVFPRRSRIVGALLLLTC